MDEGSERYQVMNRAYDLAMAKKDEYQAKANYHMSRYISMTEARARLVEAKKSVRKVALTPSSAAA